MAIRISRSTAQDPTLVAGIYNMCDQWCMYCHATAWCLAYRYEAGAQTREGEPDRDTTDALVDGRFPGARAFVRPGLDPNERVDSIDPGGR
jgi:hypothetical protein